MLHIERVTTLEACAACRSLAEAVWGEGAACSTAQLLVHAKYGGVVLIAYDSGEPVGFLFSFPVLYRGEWVLWSHETAVLPDFLHRGIGSELKRTQRRLAAELGYRTIAWTFDPLIARNAHFNLRKLGASVAEFQRNVYGQDPGDRVNRGIETDRFIAVWPAAVEPEAVPQVTSDRVPETLVLAVAEDEAPQLQPLVTALANPETLDSDVTGDLPDVVGTAIPLRFEQMLQTRTAQAWAWRYAFRTAAERLWAGGYRPTQIIRRHRDAVYCWEKGVV